MKTYEDLALCRDQRFDNITRPLEILPKNDFWTFIRCGICYGTGKHTEIFIQQKTKRRLL